MEVPKWFAENLHDSNSVVGPLLKYGKVLYDQVKNFAFHQKLQSRFTIFLTYQSQLP